MPQKDARNATSESPKKLFDLKRKSNFIRSEYAIVAIYAIWCMVYAIIYAYTIHVYWYTRIYTNIYWYILVYTYSSRSEKNDLDE